MSSSAGADGGIPGWQGAPQDYQRTNQVAWMGRAAELLPSCPARLGHCHATIRRRQMVQSVQHPVHSPLCLGCRQLVAAAGAIRAELDAEAFESSQQQLGLQLPSLSAAWFLEEQGSSPQVRGGMHWWVCGCRCGAQWLGTLRMHPAQPSGLGCARQDMPPWDHHAACMYLLAGGGSVAAHSGAAAAAGRRRRGCGVDAGARAAPAQCRLSQVIGRSGQGAKGNAAGGVRCVQHLRAACGSWAAGQRCATLALARSAPVSSGAAPAHACAQTSVSQPLPLLQHCAAPL